MYNYDPLNNQIKIDLNEDNIPIEYLDISILNNNDIDFKIISPNNIIKKFKFKN